MPPASGIQQFRFGIQYSVNEPNQTLHELTALLERLPGVSVAAASFTSTRIDVCFRIINVESIGPIAYACEGGNVILNMWCEAPGRPFRARADASLMKYRITSKNTVGKPDDALDRIQSFGVYIGWYLRGVGVLDETEANRWLVPWKGERTFEPIDSNPR